MNGQIAGVMTEVQTSAPALAPLVRPVLERARDRIADPAHWTQQTGARDADGKPVTYYSRKPAVAWCPLGAVVEELRATGLSVSERVVLENFIHRLLDLACPRDQPADVECIVWTNDATDHATVMAVFAALLAALNPEAQAA